MQGLMLVQVVAAALIATAVADIREEVRSDRDIDAEIRVAKGRVRALQVKKASIEAALMQAANGGAEVKVYPPLEETDHKFFKKDYPSDGRPDVRTHFGHPYPEVQDSEDYDNDFVKDENSDNGQFDAQMDYDRLRTLKRKEEGAVKDMQKKAGKEAEAARTKAGGAGGAGGDGSDPNKAGDKVNDAQKALGDCKSDLEAALKKLADLMDEKAAIEVKKAKAEAALVPLKQKRDKMRTQVNGLEKDLKVHVHRHSELVKELSVSKADLRKEEDKLKKALARLRKFRNQGLDENQEIYDGYRSGASPLTTHTALVGALVLTICTVYA